MEKMKFLKETFEVSGSDFAKFSEIVKELTEMTHATNGRGGDVTVLSRNITPGVQKEGKDVFYVLNAENLKELEMENNKFHLAGLAADRFPAEVREEMLREKQPILIIDGNAYILSRYGLLSLTLRSGVSGDDTMNNAGLFRDLHLASGLIRRNEKITYIYREAAGEDGKAVRKLIACMGSTYKVVPQTFLLDCIETFNKDATVGKIVPGSWTVSQGFTRIFLSMPELADDLKDSLKLSDKFVPGICLQTSDTGESSVTVRGILFKGSHYVITDEVSKKHTTGLNEESLLQDVEKRIFADVRKIPELLCKLMGKQVTPAGLNLSDIKGQEKNLEVVTKTMTTLVKRLFKGVLAQSRIDELATQLVAEINPGVVYTKYDIATTLMDMPDRISGMSETALVPVRKAAANAAYEIDTFNVSGTDEDEITLLPC